MEQIDVGELQRHAGRYLARVGDGESLEVTDRGQPVARLVPAHLDRWAVLVTAGRVSLAEDEADVTDEAPGDYGIDASDLLGATRS